MRDTMGPSVSEKPPCIAHRVVAADVIYGPSPEILNLLRCSGTLECSNYNLLIKHYDPIFQT